MGLEDLLWNQGGVATRRQLLAVASRRELRVALADGRILRHGHGRYSLPNLVEDARLAHGLSGVVSHRSAALAWQWSVKTKPEKVEITVPRGRKLRQPLPPGVQAHWSVLGDGDRRGRVTSPSRTLHDCLRSLPFDEGLAIADSALRTGAVGREELHQIAHSIAGPGARTARRVAEFADGRAANAFESVMRAIALEIPGLDVEPQVVVLNDRRPHVRPDLIDHRLGLVIEAESFEFHGRRLQLQLDCRRVNRMVLAGWTVIRFSWEDVMLHPDYVREVLIEIVARLRTDGPTDRPRIPLPAA